MSEKIYIKREIANELVWGEGPDEFDWVHDETLYLHRWESEHLLIIKRISDGKLFGAHFRRGLTEQQERLPFEPGDADSNDCIKFTEYTARERVIVDYVPVKEN